MLRLVSLYQAASTGKYREKYPEITGIPYVSSNNRYTNKSPLTDLVNGLFSYGCPDVIFTQYQSAKALFSQQPSQCSPTVSNSSVA